MIAKIGKPRHLLWLLVTALMLLLLWLTYSAAMRTGAFTVTDVRTGGSSQVELPYLEQGRGRADYRLEGNIELSWLGPRQLRIIPDDRVIALTVNEQPVDLSGISSRQLQDVQRGFAVDLSPYLHTGTNTVAVELRDFGGDMGLSIERSMSDARSAVLLAAWAVLLIGVFIAGLRLLGVPAKHGVFYTLVLIGSVVQVWYVFTYNPVDHIWSDPARHWEQGTDVLRRDLMALTDPIGYQVYVAALAKFTLKLPGLVAYCTSLLALLGPWLWYRFFRELQSSKTIALAGWAALSLLPSWTAIYGYFMQETLMLPLLGAALWATWRCRRKATASTFTLMVLLWIVAGLTRGIAIPLAAVCCTWLWLAQDKKLKKALYSSVVLLLIMGPLTYRSYQIVDHFAPHGMGHLNVIYAQSGKKVIEIHSRLGGSRWTHSFGSPSTGAEPFAPLSDWKTQRTGKVRVDVDLAAGKRDWDQAADSIDMSFRDYLWITKESFIFLFFAESWPDNNLARTVDLIGSWLRWIWAPLFVVLVVGVIVHHRKFRGHWLLPAMILAWFVVQVLIPIAINEGRYRKPFEGLAIAQLILWVALIKGVARGAAPVDHWWVRLTERLPRRRNRQIADEETV